MAYLDSNGELVTSRSQIFLNYLKGWLLLDLVASFPFSLLERFVLEQETTFDPRMLRLLRLPRLYRLMRMTRIIGITKLLSKSEFFEQLEDFFQMNASASRLMSFIVTVLTVVHIVGCFWFFIAKLDSLGPETWVFRFGYQNDSNGELYLASIYWAIQTLLTVGYGDITPHTTLELIIAIIWMVFGAGVFSYTVGNLSTVLANVDAHSASLALKLENLNIFCKETKVSQKLRDELKQNIEYTSRKGLFSMIEKQSVFNEFPKQIKSEIAKEMYGGVINHIGFFKNKDSGFIAVIVPMLQPMRVEAKEVLYRKHEYPTAIFFLTEGRVVFVIKQRIPYKEMVRGSYFGEIDILLKQKRTRTIRAISCSQLLALSKSTFESVIISEFPELVKEMIQIARERNRRFTLCKKKMKESLKGRMNSIRTIFDDVIQQELDDTPRHERKVSSIHISPRESVTNLDNHLKASNTPEQFSQLAGKYLSVDEVTPKNVTEAPPNPLNKNLETSTFSGMTAETKLILNDNGRSLPHFQYQQPPELVQSAPKNNKLFEKELLKLQIENANLQGRLREQGKRGLEELFKDIQKFKIEISRATIRQKAMEERLTSIEENLQTLLSHFQLLA